MTAAIENKATATSGPLSRSRISAVASTRLTTSTEGGPTPGEQMELEGELVYEDGWEQPAPWACDPDGTRFTAAGPPR